ncbi:MAG: hypothetical protein K5793_01885 [Nitrosarchaeum sp.]|nr:hypothetical protein [Nitrosarchaeum sp.]
MKSIPKNHLEIITVLHPINERKYSKCKQKEMALPIVMSKPHSVLF